MAEIIAPQKTVEITFSLAPAKNAIGSLSLLDMADDFSGLGDWVYQTKKTLSQDQLHTNQLVLHDAYAHLADYSWSCFPDWVEDLETQDATKMRNLALEVWLQGVRKNIKGEVPTRSELLSDRNAYLALAENFLQIKGRPFNRSFWEEVHDLLNDPRARQNLIVTHFRTMWDKVLSQEWENNLPMLEESINAFESLGLSELTAVEALNRVILRAQIPQESINWLGGLEQIIFIPSAHTGPYVIHLGGHSDTTAYFLFGARIPDGASFRTPALSRSELLMRLNALANDTRLCIMELLGQEGELGTPDITARLNLSQSAGSRHLEHLTATGYLISRQHQGINLYRLNLNQIDNTFKVLKNFFQYS